MAISSINSVDAVTYKSGYSVASTPVAEPGKAASVDTGTGSQSDAQTFEISDGSTGSVSSQNVTDVLKKAVADINKNTHNSVAQFAVHEATNRIMIKIVDKDTKEVIKEFPPEKTLDLIAKAWELAGLTVDERR